MTSKLLAAFLFLALVVLVVEAQKNETATNVIDECIKRENCAADDRECRAACAGVPDPDPKVAVDTQECYKKCADEHLPDDEDAYKSCTGECRVDVYQEGITEPGSSAPSKSQTNNGDGQESSGDGKSDNTSSEGDDDGDDESGEKEGDSKDDDSGASLVSKSALVYVFAAVLACAAFTGL